MTTKELPSPHKLRKLMRYDPDSGCIYWHKRDISDYPEKTKGVDKICAYWNSAYAGKPVGGGRDKDGYLKCVVMSKAYQAHRVAWAIYYGAWPDDQIDHINGQKDDNRIHNLRVVSFSENQKNKPKSVRNKSGIIGVHFYKPTGKWVASICVNRKRMQLGSFDTIEQAAAARKNAEAEYGFHPNHGRDATA